MIMANFIITIAILGIVGFLVYTLGGGTFVGGLTAKKDNHTKVIAEPMFSGKSVSANLVLMNENDFDISKPTLTCIVTSRSGVNLKTISSVLEEVKIAAKSSIKLDNHRITIVNDFPSKLECNISKFVQG